MLKNKKILITICSLFVILALIILTIIFKNKNNNPNYVAYEEDLLGIEFSKYVVKSSGNISNNEYATIKFEINSSLIQEFENILASSMHKQTEDEISYFQGTQLSQAISDDTKDMDIMSYYHVFKSGKKKMTRDIEAVLCQDNERYYFFIYG